MSFHRLFYHIVWATHGRQPMIVPAIARQTYEAIQDKAESLGATVFAIGGTEDHVHVAASIPPTVSLADFLGGIKGASAYHINHVPNGKHRIQWQRGYGAHSFSRERLDQVSRYIHGQKEHHGAGKVWPSLEQCDEEDVAEPTMVRESHTEYDPFA